MPQQDELAKAELLDGVGRLSPRLGERSRFPQSQAGRPLLKGRSPVFGSQSHEQRGLFLQTGLFLAKLIECCTQVRTRPTPEIVPGTSEQAFLERNDPFEINVVGREGTSSQSPGSSRPSSIRRSGLVTSGLAANDDRAW